MKICVSCGKEKRSSHCLKLVNKKTKKETCICTKCFKKLSNEIRMMNTPF